MSEFARAATALVRSRAARVRGTEDDEVVELAAYLYAIGCELLAEDRNVHMRLRRPPKASDDFAGMLERLAALSDGIEASRLYWILVDALLACENVLCRRKADAQALRPGTDLEEIRIGTGGERALGGRVLHWIRPRSVLGQERERRYHKAPRGKRPPDPDAHPGLYLDRLGMYWHSDRQLPRLSWFDPGDRTIPLIHESGRNAVKGSFRIALCPLRGEFHPLFEVWPKGRLFRAADPGMAGADALEAHLRKLVEAAAEQGVHLLVLPELTIDPPARRALAGLLQEKRAPLQPYGVVAGSFHLLGRGYARPVANESVLLDRTGAPLSSHRKRGSFRFASGFLKAAPHLFSRIHPRPAGEIHEDLEDGRELHILETSLGRLALLICADAITADDKGYLPVIRRLRPDLVLVVAMSHETAPFDDFFKEMERYGIGTVFVNADCVGGFGRKPPALAACDLALYEAKGEPPTRFRWRYRKPEAECIYHNPVDGYRRWRRLSKATGETGASWLKCGDEVLGLVVDLGVHWKKQQGNRKFPLAKRNKLG